MRMDRLKIFFQVRNFTVLKKHFRRLICLSLPSGSIKKIFFSDLFGGYEKDNLAEMGWEFNRLVKNNTRLLRDKAMFVLKTIYKKRNYKRNEIINTITRYKN